MSNLCPRAAIWLCICVNNPIQGVYTDCLQSVLWEQDLCPHLLHWSLQLRAEAELLPLIWAVQSGTSFFLHPVSLLHPLLFLLQTTTGDPFSPPSPLSAPSTRAAARLLQGRKGLSSVQRFDGSLSAERRLEAPVWLWCWIHITREGVSPQSQNGSQAEGENTRDAWGWEQQNWVHPVGKKRKWRAHLRWKWKWSEIACNSAKRGGRKIKRSDNYRQASAQQDGLPLYAVSNNISLVILCNPFLCLTRSLLQL